MQTIIFVAGVGIVGVLMILGTILLLNKEESPAQRDKKVKNQIMAEMLEAATSDEERQRILDMMDADQIDEAFGSNDNFLAPEEDKKLYGIDTESGDMLDIIIAKQLQNSALNEQAEKNIEADAENDGYNSGLFAYDNNEAKLEETMVIERKDIPDQDIEAAMITEENSEEIAQELTPLPEETTEQEIAEADDFAAEQEESAEQEGEKENVGENNPA